MRAHRRGVDPPNRNERTRMPASASVKTRPASTPPKDMHAQTTGAGALGCHFDMIVAQPSGVGHRPVEQVVARTKRVNHHVDVRQKVLAAPIRTSSDGVRKYLERKAFGEFGDASNSRCSTKRSDPALRLSREGHALIRDRGPAKRMRVSTAAVPCARVDRLK